MGLIHSVHSLPLPKSLYTAHMIGLLKNGAELFNHNDVIIDIKTKITIATIIILNPPEDKGFAIE